MRVGLERERADTIARPLHRLLPEQPPRPWITLAFRVLTCDSLFPSGSLCPPAQHRNPSKTRRALVANKKATTGVAKLVTSSLKLSGKAAKKLEKKVRRAEREKFEEKAKPKATPTPTVPAAGASVPTLKTKKAAAAPVTADTMQDVAEIIASKPRLTELRRGGRKSKAATMDTSA